MYDDQAYLRQTEIRVYKIMLLAFAAFSKNCAKYGQSIQKLINLTNFPIIGLPKMPVKGCLLEFS